MSEEEARRARLAKREARRAQLSGVNHDRTNHLVFDSAEYGRVGYRLSDGKVLEGAELFNAIGRPDLAEHYEAREERLESGKALATIGGIGLTAGTLMWMSSASWNSLTRAATPQSTPYVPHTPTTSYAVMGISGALLVTSIVIYTCKPHPVSKEETAQLVDDYNAGLLDRSKSSAIQRRLGTSSLSRVDVNVGLSPNSETGQLVMRVGF